MDRDKLREEIAIIIHEGFRSDVKAGAMADDVLSLLAPVLEKANDAEMVYKVIDACKFDPLKGCFYTCKACSLRIVCAKRKAEVPDGN